jgi:hypothetical protein
MFQEHNMAGGGIVAFAGGGSIEEARALLAQTTDPQTRAELMAEIAAMEDQQNAMPEPAVDVTAPKVRNPFDIERRELGDYLGDIRGAYKTYGVSENPFEGQKASLEEMKDEDTKTRAQAPWMALMQAGLGMAAGESPYALRNIASGGIEGLKAYANNLKDLRKSKKEIQQSSFDLARAEDALKRGDIQTAVGLARENMRDIQSAGMREAELLSREDQAQQDRDAALAREKLQQAGALERTRLQERGASNRVGAPGQEERIINTILADLKGKNPDATFSDALKAYKQLGENDSLKLFETWAKLDYPAKKAYDNSFSKFAAAYRAQLTPPSTTAPAGSPDYKMTPDTKISATR